MMMKRGLNLLLVEDDPQDAELICEVLNYPDKRAFNIHVCYRLNEALIQDKNNRFDIILTDLNLPDSKGLDSFFKLQTTFPDIPIVVLTGLDDDTAGKKAVMNGAEDFILKTDIHGGTLKRSITYAIERRKIKDRLQETNEIKELLLDVITHDLKNNAGSIYGLSSILQQKDPGDELIECITDTSERLLKVIDNASTLAKVSSGEEIDKVPLSLNQILCEVVEELCESETTNNLLMARPIDCTVIIHANPIISEVFKNYVSNAIKYSGDGEKIIIDVESDDKNVIVRVSDHGKPIPEDKREVIFDRKVQLDNGDRIGSGLGLAIVKRIALLHQGRVWVMPYKDLGNSFCIELPKN